MGSLFVVLTNYLGEAAGLLDFNRGVAEAFTEADGNGVPDGAGAFVLSPATVPDAEAWVTLSAIAAISVSSLARLSFLVASLFGKLLIIAFARA